MSAAAGARAAIAGVALLAAPAAAQRVEVGAGAAVSSRVLLDGNGTTVRLAPAPYLAIDVVRVADTTRLRLGATVRLAAGPIRASGRDASWRAGTAWQADAALAVVRPAGRGIRARAALGATLLAGPGDVQPFSGTIVSPLAEIGADVPVRGRLRADLRVQAYRVSPDGGTAGGVARVLVGASYAR